jgi:hypothetical protein
MRLLRVIFRISEVLTPNESIPDYLVQGEDIFLSPRLVSITCEKENMILILDLFTSLLVKFAVRQGKHCSYSTRQLYNTQLWNFLTKCIR